MNINEVFKRLNAGIAEAKDGAQRSTDKGEKIYLTGMIKGFETALAVINLVNLEAPSDPAKLLCLGWGERKGACGEAVPKKFLQLWCDTCNRERLVRSGKPVYNQPVYEVIDEPVIIKFPESQS